ncbi:MAG TPA: thiol reductant ABC exporter subunit CydC, partial [Thermomicrobiales bacterium]
LARVREQFYARLEPLVPARLLTFRSGDLLARMVEDVEELENVYGRVFTPLAVAGLTIALAGSALWSFSPLLGVVAVVALLVGGIGVPALAGLLGRVVGRRQIALRAELQTAVVDGITGMADLLLAGRGADQVARIAALDRELGAANRRAAWVGGLQGALGEGLAYGTLVLVLALAIPLSAADRFGPVYLAAITMIILGAYEAITPLGRAFAALGRSASASGRLREITAATPAVTDPTLPLPVPSEATIAAVSFDRVSFRYAADEPDVVCDLSFTAAPGEHVALVGPSGAGKSTVLNLLLRFWDPTDGVIRFAGHDLRAYAQDDLRQALAVVPQDAYLFGDTLRNNLLLARPDANDADLLNGIGRAGLGELLAQLPHGLDTWLGDHGLRLSGGERQRVALARAFLHDAPLLIFDEPTANLDPVTESAVLITLRAQALGRTLLVVTHRLIQMASFDTILVLDAGRIVERGTHAQLLARGGLYRRLYERQNAVLVA